jgi:cyclopropane fatty-acyl-phospholipid synthase-like methyltransferase
MFKNNQRSVALFRNTWEIYKELLSRNYMFHEELAAAVNKSITNYFKTQSISMLDIGCGDGSQIRRICNGLEVNCYHGCDLADHPLKLASQELKGFAEYLKFECVDMLEYISKTQDRFDLVLSVFSLHHLKFDEKLDLFKKIRLSLYSGGVFVLVDLTKFPNQQNQTYHDAYISFARKNWTTLSQQDLNLIEEHVRTHDYPETVDTYQKMALDAGFSSVKILAQHTWHSSFLIET